MFNELFYTLRNLKPINLPFTFDDASLSFDRSVWIEDKQLTFTMDTEYHGFDEAAWMKVESADTQQVQALSNDL